MSSDSSCSHFFLCSSYSPPFIDMIHTCCCNHIPLCPPFPPPSPFKRLPSAKEGLVFLSLFFIPKERLLMSCASSFFLFDYTEKKLSHTLLWDSPPNSLSLLSLLFILRRLLLFSPSFSGIIHCSHTQLFMPKSFPHYAFSYCYCPLWHSFFPSVLSVFAGRRTACRCMCVRSLKSLRQRIYSIFSLKNPGSSLRPCICLFHVHAIHTHTIDCSLYVRCLS